MTCAKRWNLGFYQYRGKVDKIKVKVKIKLPDNVKHSWALQVYRTAPKGKAIFTEYDGTMGTLPPTFYHTETECLPIWWAGCSHWLDSGHMNTI